MNTSNSCKKPPLFQTIVSVLLIVIVVGFFGGVLLLIGAVCLNGNLGSRNHAVAYDRMDIAQLEMAVLAFKERFGEYPPDFGEETNEQKLAAVKEFLSKAFPKCPKANYPVEFQSLAKFDPQKYNPATALVFWLGGMQDPNGNLIGFSADRKNPFDPDAKSRIGPFFEFYQQYLGKSGGGIKYYPPSNRGDRSQGCYIYFRAEDGTYAGKAYAEAGNSGAMQDARHSTGKKIEYMNPKTFQIRSFGLDGQWGSTPETRWGVLFPTATDFNPENFDDMGNFCPTTFEDRMP